MHTRRWLALGFLTLGVACGSNGTDAASGDATGAGAGAAAGSGNKGGSSGKAGSAGASGKAGGGGTGGSSILAGGASGSGGTSAGGNAGSGGASGSAGHAGTSGGGGTAGGGTAGKGGSGGTGGTTSAGGATTGGSAGTGPSQVVACNGDPDCASNTTATICDTSVNKCVACLPNNDMCSSGNHCSSATKTCVPGCKMEGDCPGTQHCDETNKCVDCLMDTDCQGGQICQGGTCHDGCSAQQACPNGTDTCCGTTCIDTTADPANCGGCGTACAPPANATSTCTGSACALGKCSDGFADCDGDPSNGCEVDLSMVPGNACLCVPGVDTQDCYAGPAGTEGKGVCAGGKQICAPNGLAFLPGCIGQVLPSPEQCGSTDYDCDGTPGNVKDVDGDGWTLCDGDCCEDTTQCGNPALVNPGAYNDPADLAMGLSDDCGAQAKLNMGKTDCSPAQTFTVTAGAMAQAMELCNTTTAAAPLPQKIWGVLSAQLLHADGSALAGGADTTDVTTLQAAILSKYGTSGGNNPRKGSTMIGMSSGIMRDESMPNYVMPDGGSGFISSVSPPAAYLGAHGGNLPALSGCSGQCSSGSGANDSVMLRLQVRVPTNAKSFSYQFRYFSSEYWTYQCTEFNDFFLTQLQSGAAGIPADKNISFDQKGNAVSVNNAFFQVCNAKGCNTCPNGTGDLAGTGMEVAKTGGGTLWLTTTSPVVPGETMTLDLMVFDVSDHILDSLAIIDDFQWLTTPSSGPTTMPSQ